MSSIKIKDLPLGIANQAGTVPCDNSAGTVTEKITLGSIRDLPHTHEDLDIKTTHSSIELTGPNVTLNIGSAKIVKIYANSAGYSIAGLSPAPADGTYTDMRLLSNIGTNNIVLLNGVAPGVEVIRCVGNTNYTLSVGGSAWVYYDTNNDCWRVG